MFNIGAMSINEIRALEDMDPVEGGDIHLVPLNMTTLENAGEPPEPVEREPARIPEAVPGNGDGNGRSAER
jgi:hypothetical protein